MDERHEQILDAALNRYKKKQRHPALLPSFYIIGLALAFVVVMYGISIDDREALRLENYQLEAKLLDNKQFDPNVIPVTYSQFEIVAEPKACPQGTDGLVQTFGDVVFCQAI